MKGELDVAELFSDGVNRCKLMLHAILKKITFCSPSYTLEICTI